MSSGNKGMPYHSVKILIGSVGSKSNKVPYVKELLRFLSQHSNLSKSVLWTPATTRVAALYAAADVYVINSQVILLHSLFQFASIILTILFYLERMLTVIYECLGTGRNIWEGDN